MYVHVQKQERMAIQISKEGSVHHKITNSLTFPLKYLFLEQKI